MQKVLITGGSRGIGRATAIQLASLGMHVLVNYKSDQQSAENLVREIQASGGMADAFQCDISDESDVVKLFNSIRQQYGDLHFLVNNAGVLFQQSTTEGLSAERINKVLATNVTGLLICCREFIKHARFFNQFQNKAIVNVSSAAARLGAAGEYIDYAASKGAVDSITKGLSLELAELGIRVNGVRPGYIYTQMHKDGGEEGRVDRIAAQLPMKRGGEPREIAEIITWLLSDASSYVTGTIIDAAGGR
ncbi:MULTISPECIES: SDR family oxidoreductase [Providencia]|uniref:SDR family oxidoreductase n=1 Tax=Providencia TaxID=586 RepID=UPI0015EC2F03|nr:MULTISPECIES: SDR family oxidoreductase [Providencia]EIU7556950.1 SDR family oxidoreductase [Providencia rettgeri]EJD6402516.1 SDR family oxidoreductase [Providencia rettgeri]EJD6501247.1 SDR family oxidoreductase [Providencia rettgeri]EJD6644770.1 SDR family oxidoreductase [Providencia rettgeri]ELL9155805.1 SDR family oxidoreductase [Providencia rettgeri]